MGHYHDLYNHKKHPGSLAISLEDMIFPVVRSQGYMRRTPTSGITQQNKSIFVATDRGAALHNDGILTHSNPN